jgi:hypothetical protein
MCRVAGWGVRLFDLFAYMFALLVFGSGSGSVRRRLACLRYPALAYSEVHEGVGVASVYSCFGCSGRTGMQKYDHYVFLSKTLYTGVFVCACRRLWRAFEHIPMFNFAAWPAT